ncbi:MAG TPA: 50S ribosomal protein L32e [Nanoarchaeota archaeon]|nr:50S ribosomal protein L32e [Nanoarchaeota archaeon]
MIEELKRLLKIRRIMKRKKPEFLRQNWFRFPRLGEKWRRPKGRHSKLRRHEKGKGFLPHPGYGSPALVRGLHPSGLKEVRVFNVNDLEGLDPKIHAVRIASQVGKKKRIEIMKKAQELGLRVLNPLKCGEENVPNGK